MDDVLNLALAFCAGVGIGAIVVDKKIQPTNIDGAYWLYEHGTRCEYAIRGDTITPVQGQSGHHCEPKVK